MAKPDAALAGLSDVALLRAHLEIHRQGAAVLTKASAYPLGLAHRHHWLARELNARGLNHPVVTLLDKADLTTTSLGSMGGGTGVTAPQQGPGGEFPAPARRRRRRRRGRGDPNSGSYPDFEEIPASLEKDATMSKEAANYREADPATHQACGNCDMFQGGAGQNGTCSLVKGVISATGVCDEYQAQEPSGEDPYAEGNVGTGDMDDMSKGDLVSVQLPLRELCILQKGERGLQRFTLSVAYPADEEGTTPDSQGEYATPDTVEQAAWFFMRKGRRSGVMHVRGASGENIGEVVESYIYRNPEPWVMKDVSGGTQVVKPGDWLVGQVWQPKFHDLIQKGRLRGTSIQGLAEREDVPPALTAWLQ